MQEETPNPEDENLTVEVHKPKKLPKTNVALNNSNYNEEIYLNKRGRDSVRLSKYNKLHENKIKDMNKE